MSHTSSQAGEAPAPVNQMAAYCPQPLRVLHVNSGNLYGGVETLLATLARLRHLCPAMEPHFALCHESRLSRELTETGVPVHMLGKVRISRPWTVWRARRRLRELLQRARFDIVVCHMPWSLVVFGGTARAAGRKLAFWAHGYHRGRNWLERLARRTMPDLAIVNSRFTATGLSSLFPALPGQVMYYPVALVNPPDRGHWRAETRRKQSVDEDTVVIVQVSRLEAWKGHMLHLDSLSRIKTGNRWVCWIVGGPQKPEEERYLHQLQKTAVELGIADRVRFLGQRSDVAQLLAAADIFCQPNQEPEPFGIVFIEALWAGRPVVTTAMGGAVEIVDESCGLVVEPGNPALLAESLRRLIESPELCRRLGDAGPARAQQLCDPAMQMKAFSELSRGVARMTNGL